MNLVEAPLAIVDLETTGTRPGADRITEIGVLEIERFELPNLKALNFVIVGYLGEGVAASTAFDPQAKGLGEYLRSRVLRT